MSAPTCSRGDRRSARLPASAHKRCSLTCALVAATVCQATRPLAADPLVFERDVRPLLKTYCLDCHGAEEELAGGLDLRLRRFAVEGGDSGPAVVPGDASASLLVQRIRSGEMPPYDKKPSPDKIAVVEEWIAAGARVEREEPDALPPGVPITPEERAYWCFQPLVRPALPLLDAGAAADGSGPALSNDDVVRTPIDAFVLARLRAAGLQFAPEADRLTLIKRAAFDLTGLPPTPAEIDAYLNDAQPDAYEAMLDRYLASPAYGERWGRHWLDVAGYADSEGNGAIDSPRPYAYKYRDYVIRSLNADLPFDQFVIEQLAGDELVERPWQDLTPAQLERLAATGFLRMGADPTAGGEANLQEAAYRTVSDALKIVSSALLGLSVGCAECHDHKYDPIPQTDYYQLRAIFEPAFDPSHWRRPAERLLSLQSEADRQQGAAIDAAVQTLQAALQEKQRRFIEEAFSQNLAKFPAELRGPLGDAYHTPEGERTAEQRKLLFDHPNANITPGVLYQYNQAAADELKADQQAIDAKLAEKPLADHVRVTTEQPDVVPATHLFHRGDYRDPRQTVDPADLTIAAPEGQRLEIPCDDPRLPTTGRRLAWARHLTRGDHPLFGRVTVNRVWLHHFGRGIVDTPGELGVLGARPTHPELLDWLAVEFAAQGWSLKQLHRTIMTSHVYRQSSSAANSVSHAYADLARQRDSLNALYWQFPVQRLQAEAIRDRILSVAGRLDPAPFGPSVAVEENFAGQVLPQQGSVRRSVYLEVRRTKPVSLLTTFDAPVMTVNCDRRVPSAGPMQSLMLMNNEWVLDQARAIAERVRREAEPDAQESTDPSKGAELDGAPFPHLPAHITAAWQLALLRLPSAEEETLATQFAARQWDLSADIADPAARALAVMTNLCQQLISSNEFLYVD